MLGQQILGMRAKKWGEYMRHPSHWCIDPLKKNSYKKNFEKKKQGRMKRLKAATVFIWDIWKEKHLKKKSKKSSKVEIFTKVKIQNIFWGKAYFCL